MNHPHPNLGAPPKLVDGGMRFIAFGGLGEVGRNMAALEHRGEILIIDCGVLFPEENQPGIDLILRSLSFDSAKAIVNLDPITGISLRSLRK